MPYLPVHIEFRRSGGFAGISLTATATADQLPEEHAGQVRELLAAQAPPVSRPVASAGGAADQFQYHLDLDDGRRHRSFTWDESQVPDEIRPLLGTLTRLARPS